MRHFSLLLIFCLNLHFTAFTQNIGIGTATPAGKLHIKGSADTSQLTIDANATQTGTHPLIRLRDAAGVDLMHIHSDNAENVFIGLNAGKSNNGASFGRYNTFIGGGSGFSNTLGESNTASGYKALFSNINGGGNTAIGSQSLSSNSTANENIAIGVSALSKQSYNNSGVAYIGANVAIGNYALYNNNPGLAQTGPTTSAILNGINNTAIGHTAMRDNTSGHENTALGSLVLISNKAGFSNTAIGYAALYSNIDGSYNTATGQGALYSNKAYNNTASGYAALSLNTSGSSNTATGNLALRSNTLGSFNTADGSQALYWNTTATQNTAIGFSALYNQSYSNGGTEFTSGNVAVGNLALSGNNPASTISGVYNTAVGYRALSSNVTGISNVALGFDADNDGNSSNYNVIIGSTAHIASGVSNSTVVGYGAYTNTPNLALLGNPSTLYTGGYSNWTNFSDGRFKTNVDENVKGLDFIMRLRPVTYHMDVRALYKLWNISPYGKEDSANGKMNIALKTEGDERIRKKESIRMSGFIAQEVEKAAQQSAYDFDGVIKPAHDKDYYRLAYGEFVVPLVKAVQEQQAIIDKQNKIIDELLKRVAALEKKK